jgi:predicted nucleic acid-binding protein
MEVVYVDTSSLVAIAFDEPGGVEMAAELARYDRLVSSNLLEAELRAALMREGVEEDGAELLARFSWILPNRPLSREMRRVADHGYLKGADLWHLACALFLAGEPDRLTFATFDLRQREIAGALGFPLTPLPPSR